MLERGLQRRRQGLEGGDQPSPVALAEVADAPEVQGQQREGGHRGGEGLGGGDGDLRPGVEVDAAAALAGDARAHHVDDAEDGPALAADLLDGPQGVEGLAGLAHRHVDGVRLNDRIAVAELRGRLGVGGDAGDALDELGPGQAGVVGRAAAEDLHAPGAQDLLGAELDPPEVGRGEARARGGPRGSAAPLRAARRSPCAGSARARPSRRWWRSSPPSRRPWSARCPRC